MANVFHQKTTNKSYSITAHEVGRVKDEIFFANLSMFCFIGRVYEIRRKVGKNNLLLWFLGWNPEKCFHLFSIVLLNKFSEQIIQFFLHIQKKIWRILEIGHNCFWEQSQAISWFFWRKTLLSIRDFEWWPKWLTFFSMLVLLSTLTFRRRDSHPYEF